MMRLHLLHSQSLQGQYRLWPLSSRETPWLRHRAQVGALEGLSTSLGPAGPVANVYGCVLIIVARMRELVRYCELIDYERWLNRLDWLSKGYSTRLDTTRSETDYGLLETQLPHEVAPQNIIYSIGLSEYFRQRFKE